MIQGEDTASFFVFWKECCFLLSQNLTFAADLRRGVRVVEGARLESVYVGNCIAGSNPALSAFARRSFNEGGLFLLQQTHL